MKDLEDELRAALRRNEPPAGFSDRVLARAAAAAEQRDVSPRRRPWTRWAVAAALCAAAGGAVEYYAVRHAREERARGEAAKQQVVQAVRIAGNKLHTVQTKLREIGS